MKWLPLSIGCLLLFLTVTSAAQNKKPVPRTQGILEVHIRHFQHQVPLQLGSVYQNQLGESFTLKKFKYYLSGFSASSVPARPAYFLVDLADSNSTTIRLKLPSGSYTSLNWLIGVDSAANCSGAQTGVLDPVHDMFWTWNTGYIQFKIEGIADSSTAPNGKFEYHIGGYRHPFNSLQSCQIQWKKPLQINSGRTTRVELEMDLQRFWDHAGVSFREQPVVAVPGEPAVKLARAFKTCFYLIEQP